MTYIELDEFDNDPSMGGRKPSVPTGSYVAVVDTIEEKIINFKDKDTGEPSSFMKMKLGFIVLKGIHVLDGSDPSRYDGSRFWTEIPWDRKDKSQMVAFATLVKKTNNIGFNPENPADLVASCTGRPVRVNVTLTKDKGGYDKHYMSDPESVSDERALEYETSEEFAKLSTSGDRYKGLKIVGNAGGSINKTANTLDDGFLEDDQLPF